jgi:hypothetical protein
MQTTPTCDAITWQTDDYIECAVTPTDRVRLEGLLLSVEADLCIPCQRHFAAKEGWLIVDVAEGGEVAFWQGKRFVKKLDRRARPVPAPANPQERG